MDYEDSKAFLWRYIREGIEDILLRQERLKSLVQIALHNTSCLYLSRHGKAALFTPAVNCRKRSRAAWHTS